MKAYTTISVSHGTKTMIESYRNKEHRETLEETILRVFQSARAKPKNFMDRSKFVSGSE